MEDMTTSQTRPVSRPGLITLIAALTLVSGVINVFWAGGLGLGLLASIFGSLCLPLAAYPFILGILEIIYSAKLFAMPYRAAQPAKYLAVMQICDLLVGNFIAAIVGIVALVLYNDAAVDRYFRNNAHTGASPAPQSK